MGVHYSKPASGSGPGILLACGSEGWTTGMEDWVVRLAEDGYLVAGVAPEGPGDNASEEVRQALLELSNQTRDNAALGAVGFGSGADILLRLNVVYDVLVCFDPGSVPQAAVKCDGPIVLQLSRNRGDLQTLTTDVFAREGSRVHRYEHCAPGFAQKDHAAFDKWAARIAYSRTLAPLRRVLGPNYDLAGLFAEHLHLEFVEKDAHATMKTMVDEPYVNHIPTRTGGVGHDLLKRFYKYHFIPTQPDNRQNTLISETVGADTVVLEILVRFTHDKKMDHMIPGVEPTGKRVELPVVVVASFRGDKLYNEHIYWDQASLLTQIGALEQGDLPISGAVAAHKLEDMSLPSNELMPNWSDSEGLPLSVGPTP